MDYYPDWLGRDLVADRFPWNEDLVRLDKFFEHYTLHDSYWIRLYAEPQHEATLLLRWDTFWTNDRVPFPGSAVAEWPILAIRLLDVRESAVELLESGIAAAECQTAGDHLRTTVEDHAGGNAVLVHAPAVRMICLSRDRETLAIPL